MKTFSHILLNTISAESKLKEAVPIFLDDTSDHLSHILAHCLTITIAIQPPGGPKDTLSVCAAPKVEGHQIKK